MRVSGSAIVGACGVDAFFRRPAPDVARDLIGLTLLVGPSGQRHRRDGSLRSDRPGVA